MKKKVVSLVSAMLAMCMMLTGCMVEDVTLDLNKDGSGKVEVAAYVSDEALKELGISASDIFGTAGGETTTKKMNGKSYTGTKVTEEFKDLTELNAILGSNFGNADAGEAASMQVGKQVKDGKEIVTLTGVVQSDSEMIKESGDEVNTAGMKPAQLEGILSINFKITFPDGVTGVTGIPKNQFRLDGNTISFTLTSGTSVKKFTVSGSLGAANYQRFPVIREYKNNFKDVPADSWYVQQLTKAYNLGILSGTSETTFNPNSYLTLAQVTVMASRVRSIYDGDNAPFNKEKESDAWYKPYLDYAVKKGIINNAKEFSDYTRPATRAEMVHIFAKALPAEAFKSINSPKVFEDVATSHKYYSDIMSMYSAGVIMGTTATTFAPNSNVTRAQAAVIIARVAEIGDKVPR